VKPSRSEKASLSASSSSSTARKREREEEDLRRFAAVVRDSNDAITIQDFEGGITAWNRGAELMYGYSEEEALRSNINLLTPPDKVAEQKAFIQRLVAGESVTSFETQRVTKGGRTLDVWMTVTKLMDEAGKPIALASTERDITARKRHEESLRRMATVVRDSNDAITIQDFEGGITAWNHGAELMYGYSEEEALRSNINLLTPPDKVAEQKAFIQRLVAGEDVTSFETQRVAKDGRVLDVWMTVTKLVDDAGKPIGLASTERNSTDRRQAKERLAQSELVLASVIEQNPSSTWISDGEGTLVKINQACCELFGVTEAEVVGKFNILHDNLVATQGYMPLVRGVFEKGTIARFTIDYDARDVTHIDVKAGRRRILDVVVSPIRDAQGKVTNAIVQHRDATELKQAEAEIRIKNQVFEDSIASQSIADKDGGITHVNPAFVRLWGYAAKEDAIGKSVGSFFANPADATSVLEALAAHDAWDGEFLARRTDGTTFISRGYATSLRNAAGELIGYQSTNLDVTKERESEERFSTAFMTSPYAITITRARDGKFIDVNEAFTTMAGFTRGEVQADSSIGLKLWTNSEDRDRVINDLRAGRTVVGHEYQFRTKSGANITGLFSAQVLQLSQGTCIMSSIDDITERKRLEEERNRIAEDLKRSNKELEQFAYVASHDLQEPLRMVSSYVQLLAQRYEAQLDDKARKYIGYAVDGALRMQQLIEDLLLYSRAGTHDDALEPTDSGAALGAAVQSLAKAIEESGASVTHDALPVVRADTAQLAQVFQNLLSNAVKFHGEAPPRVHVSAEDRKSEWVFSVRDNGIGIDPRHADRVFVLFQRLHTRQEYPGTGIGLAVSRKTVEHRGGRIWFESEPGVGSTFYFTIPK